MNFSGAAGVITNDQSKTVAALKVTVTQSSFISSFIHLPLQLDVFFPTWFCALAIKQNLQWPYCWTSLEIGFYFVPSQWNWKRKSFGRVEKDKINNNNNTSAAQSTNLIVFTYGIRWDVMFTGLCPCQHTVAP